MPLATASTTTPSSSPRWSDAEAPQSALANRRHLNEHRGDVVNVVDATAEVERPLLVGAAAFLVASVAIAFTQAIGPMDRGWWLVAFFGLVGGLSQWLLGAGLVVISRDAGYRDRPSGASPITAVLWNGGAVLVAAADLADVTAGVLIGSAALLAALVLFGRALLEVVGDGRGTALSVAYATLLAFLTASVLVGAGLAGALPGQ
jgi:hypothetical protein